MVARPLLYFREEHFCRCAVLEQAVTSYTTFYHPQLTPILLVRGVRHPILYWRAISFYKIEFRFLPFLSWGHVSQGLSSPSETAYLFCIHYFFCFFYVYAHMLIKHPLCARWICSSGFICLNTCQVGHSTRLICLFSHYCFLSYFHFFFYCRIFLSC